MINMINKVKSAAKNTLKKILTPGQRETVKRLLDPARKKQNLQREIEQLRFKLLELGFGERAIADLDYIVHNSNKIYLRKLAAWELARWYANQRTPEGARRCLEYLTAAVEKEKEERARRQAAVLQAECYELLGEKEKGMRVIREALSWFSHPDLFLAAANLQDSIEERLKWANKALEMCGTASVSYGPGEKENEPVYDRLIVRGAEGTARESTERLPLVTVIVPAFNSQDFIPTALASILRQSWSNIEVLVVDDCSTDNTAEIVKEFQEKDERVRLMRTALNSGPYVARNTALKEASGELVTTNDADDWSHPEKLERQVRHLLRNPEVVANMSEQVRATAEMKFYRRGNYGRLVFSNLSSLMFRREQVSKSIGFWDSVRFGADNEFLRRLRKVFGQNAVVNISTGPLSFQRQTGDSLTGSSYFGYHGYYMGARKEYFESHEFYHQRAKSFYYSFPQEARPFPVPEPMWPEREEKPSGRRYFDVVLMSDFRLTGKAARVNREEIERWKQKGCRVGLVQVSCYPFNHRRMLPGIRELLDGDRVQVLVYGEKISCGRVILRFPEALQERQRHLPEIEPEEVRVVLERLQVEKSGKKTGEKENSALALAREEIERCRELLQEYLGKQAVWHPAGPEVRSALMEHLPGAREMINLSDEDWVSFREGTGDKESRVNHHG